MGLVGMVENTGCMFVACRLPTILKSCSAAVCGLGMLLISCVLSR